MIACLAHNLGRWIGILGVEDSTLARRTDDPPLALIALPGRLTRTARRWTYLPARWSWQRTFVEALTRIRALPAAA